MPISRQVRMTRTAISPRFAIRTFFSTPCPFVAGREPPPRARRDLQSGHSHTPPRVGAMSHRGYEIEHFETIDSTNTHLLERARQGAPAGLVAVADHQTRGRGRLDRRWESPPESSLLPRSCSESRSRLRHSPPGSPARRRPGRRRRRGRLCGLRPGAQVAQRPLVGRSEARRRSWPRSTTRPLAGSPGRPPSSSASAST